MVKGGIGGILRVFEACGFGLLWIKWFLHVLAHLMRISASFSMGWLNRREEIEKATRCLGRICGVLFWMVSMVRFGVYYMEPVDNEKYEAIESFSFKVAEPL